MDSLLVAAASGRLSELMMTKPKPSLSLRLMMTSLGCVLGVVLSAVLGAWVVMVLLAYVKSLRGELCCVETEPGLRPFSGQDSPVGGGRELSRQKDGSGRSIFSVLTIHLFPLYQLWLAVAAVLSRFSSSSLGTQSFDKPDEIYNPSSVF